MAYPVDDPVRKAVIDNVVSSLQGINGSSPYRTAVATVEVAGLNALSVDAYPSVVIGPQRATFTDNRYPMIQVDLSFEVEVAVESNVSDETVYDLIEDVRIALTTDITRGGVALDTHVEDADPWVQDIAGSIRGARMVVRVQYRHLRLDPATAV